VLDVSVKEEACSLNLAPTASTTAALVLGDALAVALLERRGFGPDDFAALHPGGRLGMQLKRVEHVMHKGDDVPRVDTAAKLPDVIYEMSKKGLGMTTVVDGGGRLLGVITDGDLRRAHLREEPIALLTAGTLATGRDFHRDADAGAKTVRGEDLAVTALELMESHAITSLVIVDAGRRPVGVIHLHDILRAKIDL